jgi:hypothetical protein
LIAGAVLSPNANPRGVDVKPSKLHGVLKLRDRLRWLVNARSIKDCETRPPRIFFGIQQRAKISMFDELRLVLWGTTLAPLS